MAYLDGTQALTRALRSLPAKVGRRVLKKSAAKGAAVVRESVKARAPVGKLIRRRGGRMVPPGTIKRSVYLRYSRSQSSEQSASYIVTLRYGGKHQKNNRDAFYWAWVEKGHRIVRRGKTYGNVAPRPFFVPAYRASQAKALGVMRSTMEQETAKVINEANRG